MSDDELADRDRLRALVDRLPAMVAYWDADLRNVVANQAHCDFFGKTPEEIRGRHIFELLVGELGEASRPYVEAAMGGRDQIFEKTLVDHHGVTRHVQACYMPEVVGGKVGGLYVQVADVTGRVEAERARDDAQRLLHISRENAPFGEAMFSTAGRALYVNPSLCLMLGQRREDAEGLHYLDGVHPDDRDAAQREWRQLVEGSVLQVFAESRYCRRDDTTIWVQRHSVFVPGSRGSADVVLTQFQDVTERKTAEAEFARLAVTDPLTGLHNRHSLVTRLAEHRAAEPSAYVGIVFADLDGFKDVNDVYGHAAGDAVLQAVASRLAEEIEPPNSVYRLGGDEFVVLAVDAVTEDAVARLAERVGAVMSGGHRVEGTDVTLTASVGWTCSVTADIGELIREADADMYRDKARRRRAVADG
ncbi:sensor domain-containing diguanylate cyclase [Mycobacterium yunnanensis]|uniref:Sensor domain-containing diguanylate cyclase n=1 Tax=Mycobacterium yunnanensis TaxID=368477 RepID=A0A9X2Z582_9MYCO|nr:sensor domain-containing diguanylate cyclase [Mycobacterium yunnanensis]MCV7422709.1 sensor domain-containing diguanylate cyclase [Mycobacterium yunnanensis]